MTTTVVPNLLSVPTDHTLDKLCATIAAHKKLPPDYHGYTSDGRRLFRGDILFALKDTHGFPLNMALDMIINQRDTPVDWPAFIEAARQGGWWDYQTYEVMQHALADGDVPVDTRYAIMQRFKQYVLRYPHPKMI